MKTIDSQYLLKANYSALSFMTKALLTNCEIVCDGCNCIINHSGDVAFVTEMPQVLEEVRVLLADTLELTLDDIVVSYVIQSAA